jgi:hypothetical protein
MTDRREPHLTHDSHGRSRCGICRMAREGNVDIPRVEALLAVGARLKPLAKKFGIPPFSLRRHWMEVSDDRKQYLRFGARLSREAMVTAVTEEKLCTLDHLRILRAGLHRGFQLALQTADLHALSSIANALSTNIQQTARLAGEWTEEPRSITTNVQILQLPAVAGVISGITAALARFPEARAQVIQYLRTADDVLALPAPEVIDAATRE